MGDTHFILRHALTGAVFLLFFGIGCWAFGPDRTQAYLRAFDAEDISHVLTIAVTSAIVGITIQGCHIGFLSLASRAFRRKGLFTDRARELVKDHVETVFAETAYQVDPADIEKARKAEADAYFVWLYHRLAPNDLIEWARRRRSYFYLGKNWALACLFGWLAAAAWMNRPAAVPHEASVGLLALASLAWAVAAWLLADQMKKDVDEMEFLWAAARVNPKLRARLTEDLQPQDDTKLSGALDVVVRRGSATPASGADSTAPPALG